MPQNPNIPNPQQFEPSMLAGLKSLYQGAPTPSPQGGPHIGPAVQDTALPNPGDDQRVMGTALSGWGGGLSGAAALPEESLQAIQALRGAVPAARGASEIMDPAMDLMEGMRSAPEGHVAPLANPLEAVYNKMYRSMGPQQPPSLPPSGGAPPSAAPPISSAGDINPAAMQRGFGQNNPVFQRDASTGMFGGDRTVGSLMPSQGALAALRRTQ